MLASDGAKLPLQCCMAWSTTRPVRVSMDGSVVGLLDGSSSSTTKFNDIAYTPDAGSLLVNRNVLARSKIDGYFYKGKVINQV
jgi:hypothetical protein